MVASVFLNGENYTMTGFSNMMPDRGSDEREWQTRFLSSEIVGDWKIQLEIQGSMDQIKADISINKAIAVSNGSFQHDSSAAAWVIEGSTGAN